MRKDEIKQYITSKMDTMDHTQLNHIKLFVDGVDKVDGETPEVPIKTPEELLLMSESEVEQYVKSKIAYLRKLDKQELELPAKEFKTTLSTYLKAHRIKMTAL